MAFHLLLQAKFRSSGFNGIKFNQMKLKHTWLAVWIGLLLGAGQRLDAQNFSLQHTFANLPDGANPGLAVWTNGFFYGATANGGTNGNGMIYKFNPNGAVYSPVFNFNGDANNGSSPNNLLVTSNMIYGTTEYGGTNGGGMIFAVNTNGTGFTSLYSFSFVPPDGTTPVAGLTLSGSTLYGTANTGGTNFGGILFKINTNGTGYSILHWFTNNPDGFAPQSELLLSGSTLYGTTKSGGTSSNGVVFSINVSGSGYAVLRSFTNFPDAQHPYGGLVLNSGILYGTTASGGSNTTGTIFAMGTDGSGYRILYHFSGTVNNLDGWSPKGTLIFNGGNLYGTTSVGGASGQGTIFQISTNGTGYTVLKTFTGNPDGANPMSAVTLQGTNLWGTTFSGGSGYGILFSQPLAPPAITQQPQSLTVTNGNPASFTVAVTGSPSLAYQWYFNTNTPVSGGTNASLNIASASTTGYYTVIVTNSYGSVTSSPALLTVTSSSAAPTITQQPQNYTVTNGYSASFTNVASSGTSLYYQWYFNTNTPVAGGTNSILLITFAGTNNAGYYSVVVSNLSGSVTSSPAKLTVVSTLPIIFSQPQALTVTNGDTANFTVLAAGQSLLKYQWYSNSVATAIGTLLAGKTNSTCSFTTATNMNGRFYSVVITNTLGKATSSPAMLTIISKPVIATNPQPQTVSAGATATFSVTAWGASLRFQWYSNSINTAIGTLLAGQTNDTCSFTAATNQNGRYYSVVVTNTYGKATSSPPALLTVQLASAQPKLLSYSLIPASSSFSLTLSNTASSANRLWASTNLTSTNFWRVIASNTMAANGLWSFTDTNTVKTNAARFYRASSP